jgi:hypothetical protein
MEWTVPSGEVAAPRGVTVRLLDHDDGGPAPVGRSRDRAQPLDFK